MFRRVIRALPGVMVACAVAALGAGSLAVASDNGTKHRHGGWHHHHGHGHHHGWDRKSCNRHRVSGLDEQWLRTHIQTDLFEIAGGQAALERATSEEVRTLAAELVRDHTADLAISTALAEQLGIAVPTEPAPLQQWALETISELEGTAFDQAFVDLQIAGHRQAIGEAQAEASKGCNATVQGLAAAKVPILEQHLQHAEALAVE